MALVAEIVGGACVWLQAATVVNRVNTVILLIKVISFPHSQWRMNPYSVTENRYSGKLADWGYAGYGRTGTDCSGDGRML